MLLYVHRNRRLNRDGSPGRPPRLPHSSWALYEDVPLVELMYLMVELMCLMVELMYLMVELMYLTVELT